MLQRVWCIVLRHFGTLFNIVLTPDTWHGAINWDLFNTNTELTGVDVIGQVHAHSERSVSDFLLTV